jgi:hypothetical protein
MGTMKHSLLRAGWAGLVATAALVASVQGAAAQGLVVSDQAAAIVVYPKIVVNSSAGVNTLVEIANHNVLDPVGVHCFYVNAYGRCSVNSNEVCLVNFDCPEALAGETCDSDWRTTDFSFTLTREQVIGWNARDGLQFLPCDPSAPPPSVPSCSQGGQQNASLSGPGAAVSGTDDPFIGELKCVEVDPVSDSPLDGANDLFGRAVIENVNTPDIAIYNAIGIQDLDGTTNNGDNTLCLGGQGGTNGCPDPEYASCPAVLLLDHFYDGAVDPAGATVTTRLTLIPCTEFEEPRAGHQSPDVVSTTVSMLTFNEFEQRFSATTRVKCFLDLQLSDLDTRASFPGDDGASVFNVAVNGTLTGQTRIRGVGSNETDAGHGLLGIATESHTPSAGPARTASYSLAGQGTRDQGDVVSIAPGP